MANVLKGFSSFMRSIFTYFAFSIIDYHRLLEHFPQILAFKQNISIFCLLGIVFKRSNKRVAQRFWFLKFNSALGLNMETRLHIT